MLATVLMRVPLVLLPFFELPPPTAGCQMEVLTQETLDERAITSFTAAVDRYVALHRRLERSLPPEQMFEDAEDMFAAREALRVAIVDARPNARQGNVFTPAAGDAIRRQLLAAIRAHRYTPGELLAIINEEHLPGMPEPEINQEYPWAVGTGMPPMLLNALPTLPRELEFRFFDRNLVLVDIHANLVVDILNDALPEAMPAVAVS